MEEEIKEVEVEEEPKETKKKESKKAKNEEPKQEKTLAFPVNLIFALIAVGLIVMVKLLINFGVMTQIFYGIMTIAIFALPIVGGALSYATAKKPNFEFYANVAALFIALLCL